jgi:hypothetical protein
VFDSSCKLKVGREGLDFNVGRAHFDVSRHTGPVGEDLLELAMAFYQHIVQSLERAPLASLWAFLKTLLRERSDVDAEVEPLASNDHPIRYPGMHGVTNYLFCPSCEHQPFPTLPLDYFNNLTYTSLVSYGKFYLEMVSGAYPNLED